MRFWGGCGLLLFLLFLLLRLSVEVEVEEAVVVIAAVVVAQKSMQKPEKPMEKKLENHGKTPGKIHRRTQGDPGGTDPEEGDYCEISHVSSRDPLLLPEKKTCYSKSYCS